MRSPDCESEGTVGRSYESLSFISLSSILRRIVRGELKQTDPRGKARRPSEDRKLGLAVFDVGVSRISRFSALVSIYILSVHSARI